MDLKLDIKPEDIEKAVVQAIIESSIGTSIKQRLDEILKGYQIKNAIEEVIVREIKLMVREVISNDPNLKLTIETKYKEKITQDLLDKAVNFSIEKLIKEY